MPSSCHSFSVPDLFLNLSRSVQPADIMLTEVKSFNEQYRQRLSSLIPRYVLLLSAGITTICFVVTLVLSNSRNWPEDLKIGNWGEGLALASVLPSLCWSSFCIIQNRFSKFPLHTGWLLSLDLICFLAIATCCPLGMPSSSFWSGGQECLVPTDEAANGPVSASCERLIHLVWVVEMTAFAGAYLTAIIHFSLFVIACRATDLYNREKKKRNKAGKKMKLSAYPWNESQEPIVGISSPHELDTRKSQGSKGGCAWASEVSSGQDHDCAVELECGGRNSLVGDCDSARKSSL